MQTLVFSSEHFFASENNANKHPYTFTELAFSSAILRKEKKATLMWQISFCVSPWFLFHLTASKAAGFIAFVLLQVFLGPRELCINGSRLYKFFSMYLKRTYVLYA